MNDVLVDAIRSKRRLQLVYDGKAQVVEPQCCGIGTTGTELLRVRRLRGGAHPERLLDVAKIDGLAVLAETVSRR